MVRILFIILINVIAINGAVAQERFALVIGNSAYETISPLETPQANSDLIASQLAELGFDVTLIQDANLVEMKRSIGRYGIHVQEAPEGSVGIIYFSGHGVNAFSDNFLLPVDVSVETAEDLDFVAVDVDSLAFTKQSGDFQNLIILDCCVATPLASVPDIGGNGLFATSVSDGNFITYSTPANGVIGSSDLTFAEVFVDEIQTPGQSIEATIAEVSDRLVAEYGDTQTLFWSSSLADPYVFVAVPELSDEEKAWIIVQDNADVSSIMAFVERFPTGEFSNDAKRLLLEVLTEELAEDTEPAPEEGVEVTEEEPAPEELPVETVQEEPIVEEMPADAVVEESPVEVVLEESAAEELTEETGVAVAIEDTPIETDAEANGEEAPAETAEVEEDETPLPTDLNVARVVRYTEPLTEGSSDILGQSLEELVTGKPLFPPIEDLPEVVWKDKSCSDCHQWTPEDLCAQAKFYIGEDGIESLAKEHPYGGSFKENLLVWAQGDCQE